MINKQPRAAPPFPVAGHIAYGEPAAHPLAAELDAIAKEMADFDTAEYATDRALVDWATRLSAVAQQLKG